MLRNIKHPCTLNTLTLSRKLIVFILLLFINIYASDINVLGLTSESASADGTKPADGQENGEKSIDYKVGVEVDLVMVYTSVFDKEGRFVSGLKKEDFNVYEDGDKQEITSFSQIDLPVTIGIILDLSGSMEGKMEQVNRAARAFVQASNPNDQIFLVGFNDEVDLLRGFTSDVDEITDALENSVTMGGTVLYDAIYLGVEEAHRGAKSKKAIIVITDGEDKDSVYSLNELVTFIQSSDVQVYNVGFIDETSSKSLFSGWFKTDEEKARDALKRISEESGGKAYFPEEISEIHGIVAEIAAELRNQYSIGYFSSNEKRDGSWRRIVVKVDKNSVKNPQIRHRRGYFAPKD